MTRRDETREQVSVVDHRAGADESLLSFRRATLAVVALGVGLWTALAPMFLSYPVSESGVDAQGRELVLGVLVGIVAVAALRSDDGELVPWLALAVLGGVLAAVPLFVESRFDALEAGQVSDLLCGATILVVALVGMAMSVHARRLTSAPEDEEERR